MINKTASTPRLVSEKRGPMGEEFAVATTDVAFKNMLSITINNDKTVMQSFLNCFVPEFETDPVDDIWEEKPAALPALKRKEQKQTFMDLYVATKSGAHYIVEMQAKRHELFDERALYYAAKTYSNQLDEKSLQGNRWYTLLRPVVGIQVLNFDTNRAKGKKGNLDEEAHDTRQDHLFQRVTDNPLKEGEYIKDFRMTCQHSGQRIDDIRLIQIELPRSTTPFPPNNTFTDQDWWLCILRYSEQFTHAEIESFEQKGIRVPAFVYSAMRRLDYAIWSPTLQVEYKEQLSDRSNFKTTLTIEFQEGEAQGMEKGMEKGIEIGKEEGEKNAKLAMARNMLKISLDDQTILHVTGLSASELQSLKLEK